MTLMREYYKNMLTPSSQRIYEKILENINKLARNGYVELHGFYSSHSLEDAANAYIALKDDRPEFYFMDNTIRVTLSPLGVLKIEQNKRFTFSQIKRINNLLRREIKKILNSSNTSNVLIKEKRIYKKIAATYKYNEGELSHDLSGLLVYKEGVCEALAGLLVIALREAGIPAIKVNGIAKNENHCWTKAWIDGTPYHLDVTWDLPLVKLCGHCRYFNVTEDVIKRDHRINTSIRSRIDTAACT